MDDRRLLILGASARAAAQSAVRAGLQPVAIDQFADVDLTACCRAMRSVDYPRDLPRLADEAPACDWMYVGALENHPTIVEQIARRRRLLGTGAEAVRAVRNPFRLAAALKKAKLPAPAVAREIDGVPRDGSWLCKPLASAGGTRIEAWTDRSASQFDSRRHYLQQRIEGDSASAAFVAADHRAVLLGAAWQWNGLAWTGASGFQYCGSFGPMPLDSFERRQLAKIGTTLAKEFGLTGLFGVDLIADHRGFSVVEVNPRYSASMETLEQSLGFCAVAVHLAACRQSQLPSVDGAALALPPRFCGKAILYARQYMRVEQQLADWIAFQNQENQAPAIADIPPLGAEIAAGRPILTVLASGERPPEVRAKLERMAAEAPLA